MSAKDRADAQSDVVAAVQQGYAFDGPALELGALVVDGTAAPGRRRSASRWRCSTGTAWSPAPPAPARPRRCS